MGPRQRSLERGPCSGSMLVLGRESKFMLRLTLFTVSEQDAVAVCICGVQISAENLTYVAFLFRV